MSDLFKPDIVYPSDEMGPYVELTGTVVGLGDRFFDEVRVDVQTEHGILSGYTPRPPKIGYQATIRHYRSGGGWYPDDRIVGWSDEIMKHYSKCEYK